MKPFKGCFCLALALALTGCASSNLEISEKDILEVARDDANATKSECQNVSIEKEKSHYNVSFDTANGSYTYKIGTNGIIQERSYTKSENAEEETTASTTTETTEKETKKKEEKKEEEKTEEKETTEESTSSFDDNQQQAINAVLGNMGMIETDVTNLTCTLSADGTQYEVTCNTGEYNITSIVDAASFTVLSTVMG